MPSDTVGDAPHEPVEKPTSLKLTPEIRARVRAAVSATGLKQADVMRLAIERGIDVLVKQLEANAEESK